MMILPRKPVAPLSRRHVASLSLSYEQSPCHAIMPTLVVEPDGAVADALTASLGTLGIGDVDIVGTLEDALRRIGEREYSIIVVRHDAGPRALVDLFVTMAASLHGEGNPAMVVTGAGSSSEHWLPVPVEWLPEPRRPEEARAAVRRAVAAAGTSCGSAPYCRRRTCPLLPSAA
ncbi:hypothetical protein [Alsobacter sp. R-9]